MKKLSVLIALALVLTIGGAYATWSFVSGDIQDENSSSIISMEETSNAGAIGAYSFENTLVFKVDSDGSLNTKLVATGSLKIIFTPAASAPDAYKTGATPSTLTISVAGTENKYLDNVLLSEVTDGDKNVMTISPSGEYQWTAEGNAFSVTIPATDIAAALNLTSINLPNIDAYNAYAAVLGNYTINFDVSAD